MQTNFGQLAEQNALACVFAGQKAGQQVHFKIIDYGHARLSHHRVRRKLPKIPVFEVCYQRYVFPQFTIYI